MLFVNWLLRKFVDENIFNTQCVEIWPGLQIFISQFRCNKYFVKDMFFIKRFYCIDFVYFSDKLQSYSRLGYLSSDDLADSGWLFLHHSNLYSLSM